MNCIFCASHIRRLYGTRSAILASVTASASGATCSKLPLDDFVWFLIALPGIFQLGLGAVALASVAFFVWRQRLESARERNWVGEFSFGDVVRRRRADEALEVAAH